MNAISEHLGLSEPDDARPLPPDVGDAPVEDERRDIAAIS